MSRIISFRGLLADLGIDTIPLQTNNGLTGYKIVKFELLPYDYASKNSEHLVQIWKVSQDPTAAAATLIDFSDNRLLAAGTMSNSTTGNVYPPRGTVIFENEVFNQDIYVTHVDKGVSEPCNYYIELEQMDLALDEATVATLKDIRNND